MDNAVVDFLKKNIKWEHIRDHIEELSSVPHVAGSLNNELVADVIARKWKQAGLEDVHFLNYNVLLSSPNFREPNSISILDSNGKTTFKSTGRTPVVFPEQQHAFGADIDWVAYSDEGEVSADVVYCNFGLLFRPCRYRPKRNCCRRCPEVSKEWQGGLNATYRMGPALMDGCKVKIVVHSKVSKRPIRNIVGYIRGSEEMDKYVILGNHHDAWVYGSVDPVSGTAVQLEMARAFVQTMKQHNWRPKRTIMFINFDAEEFGLLGSTEFVEEFTSMLKDRTIVYLNVDNVHANGSLHVSTIPSLYRVAYETAKLVDNPMVSESVAGRWTVYDTWKHYYPGNYAHLPEAPQMPIPGGNSDHAPFLNYLGLPVTHMSYQGKDTYLYPLYHTMYETPFLNEHLDYVTNFVKYLRRQERKDLEFKDAGRQAKFLLNDAKKLLSRTIEFERRSSEQISPSSVNDRILAFHKCFVDPRGLTGQPSLRHVIYSVSEKNSNTANVFSVVYSLVDEILSTEEGSKRKAIAKELAYQISILQYSMKCAANSLKRRI
ncbi:hypothetical protein QR680_003022 [Steinernema hermaphroditum]|uniref:Peptidase M28 domain-containing protein n=1 Tax=Steinernema hermaphroditum TaxID=289476 RepID=A0AA39H6Z8_9BILA|nr:hypothetical protein QR680_003022 [Steinernema hermaphroditum]